MSVDFNDLPPRISEILYRAGYTTCKSILESEECELLNLGNLSEDDIKQIICVATKEMPLTKFIAGDSLAASSDPRWGRLSTGCEVLDQLLGGGLLNRGLTELAGHSGCGKTQLCLQLALTVQLPKAAGGLGAGAVFICTEDKFPSVRLHQILSTSPVAQQFPNIKFGNNIFVEHISEATDLMQCISYKLPHLLEQHPIGLVVIDSVAAAFRADYTQTETLQRARDLRDLAANLHRLANTLNIAVLCVNQVSDIKRGDHSMTIPALGLAWANLVTCRLIMSRQHNTRRLQVGFAPHLPQTSCQYVISDEGVRGIGPIVRC